MSSPYIRRATKADTESISHICLLSANAGKSSINLHKFSELPGVVWAEPYLNLPSGTGFVLIEPSSITDPGDGLDIEEGRVVGYTLVAFNTPSFERELESLWYPRWRKKYPIPFVPEPESHIPNPTEEDMKFINMIHHPKLADKACLEFSPAHMHINILPEYQHKGWGKKLIGTMIKFLKEEKGVDAVWVRMDPRNLNARDFYQYVGYRPVEGADPLVHGLRFQDWVE
ncbi:Acyl-CoA N-acyltransferase [Abortiporus biennis]